jgi:thioredoxin-like negative regulator of GroEL
MYERLLIAFAIMTFFGVALFLMKRRQIAQASRASHRVKNTSKIPTIVYFWSNGCPVCKMTQKKILGEILAEYGKERLALTAYNTDEEPDVAKEWGVRTLPTTFLIDSTGAIRHVNNGLVVSENLRRQLETMIFPMHAERINGKRVGDYDQKNGSGGNGNC